MRSGKQYTEAHNFLGKLILSDKHLARVSPGPSLSTPLLMSTMV